MQRPVDELSWKILFSLLLILQRFMVSVLPIPNNVSFYLYSAKACAPKKVALHFLKPNSYILLPGVENYHACLHYSSDYLLTYSKGIRFCCALTDGPGNSILIILSPSQHTWKRNQFLYQSLKLQVVFQCTWLVQVSGVTVKVSRNWIEFTIQFQIKSHLKVT